VKISVFTKIFAYTMLLLILMCLAAGLLFARQFFSFYRDEQQLQLSAAFRPMIALMSDRNSSPEEIIEQARIFANNNQSFNFIIQQGDGTIIFSTPHTAGMNEIDPGQSIRVRFVGAGRNPAELNPGELLDNAYTFTGYSSNSGLVSFGSLLRRLFIAIGLMLVIAILGAMLFARGVTRPLEDEIVRERAMEENQRLFFSAASHELKTPIAAARALVEGMIAGVGDYKDHRKYLRECLKTLDSQTRLVSEILEIVKLSDTNTRYSTNKKNTTDTKYAVDTKYTTDLGETGNAVLDEYKSLADQKGLEIQGVFPRISVRADRNLLQRVLSNVIANAVQNTNEGGTIRINSVKQQNLRLEILNTGAHIPDEALSKVFEPFFHSDSARSRHGSQSGLGLAIVKKALDRMDVPFGMENTPEGVLFWMEFIICG